MYLPTLSASCLLVALTLLWTWKHEQFIKNVDEYQKKQYQDLP